MESRPIIHIPRLSSDEEAIYDDNDNVLVEAYCDNAIDRMIEQYDFMMQDYPIDTGWRDRFDSLPF